MRVFKKIMYIVLALLPIFPLLLFAVCNIGNVNGVEIMPFGSFAVAVINDIDIPSATQTGIFVEKDTILSNILAGVIPKSRYIQMVSFTITEDDEFIYEVGLTPGDYDVYVCITDDEEQGLRFVNLIANFYKWFDSAGMTPVPYVVLIVAYFCYMVFVQIAFMLFDIITFVPRKISEMLEV